MPQAWYEDNLTEEEENEDYDDDYYDDDEEEYDEYGYAHDYALYLGLI